MSGGRKHKLLLLGFITSWWMLEWWNREDLSDLYGLEGLDVTRVTFGSNGIHTRFTRLAGIVRTSFSNEPHLFSAHLQEDGALEFKEDRHAQNVHTVKNLAFVVCRAKGRLRLAVLLGSGLVRSFGVLVFRMVAELLREHPSVAVCLEVAVRCVTVQG